MLLCLLLTVILLCVIHVLFNYNSVARALRKLPGPADIFIFGNMFTLLLSPSDKLMDLGRDLASRFNGIYRFWIFPIGAVFIYNPQDIEIITSTVKHSEKSMVYGNFLRLWLQDGLLLSNGGKWQTRRKILTPTFHFKILRQFSVILQENVQRFLMSVNTLTESNVDVVPLISEFTLNSICGFLFRYTSWAKTQTKLLERIHSFTRKVIDQRKKSISNTNAIKHSEEFDDIFMNKKKKVAMLDLLITAEKDGLIDGPGIQEEVDTFMFEGHDTTASGLTFCFMALANHRDIQNKAAAEIIDMLSDSERAITMEDISNMPYLDRCIKESLRMYPPVHFISRRLTEDVKLSDKYEIPAGLMCHVSIYDLHHRADLYPDPSRFDPDRFLPEQCARRHPYAYIPFSAGPRNCIGQKFALMEMKLVLAEVLRRFELQPVTRQEDLNFVGDLILRNKGPIYVKFAKRNKI